MQKIHSTLKFYLLSLFALFFIASLHPVKAQTPNEFLEMGSIYFKKPLVENQSNRVYSIIKNTSTTKDFSGQIKITFKNQNEVVLDSTTQCLSVIANDSDAVFMDITPPKGTDVIKTIVEVLTTNHNPVINHTQTNSVDKDNDGDGMGNLTDDDDDNDGLPDTQEMVHNSDPKNPDTDKDTLKDGKEVTVGTSPTKNDTDGDKVADNKDFYPLDPQLSSPPLTYHYGGVSGTNSSSDKFTLADNLNLTLPNPNNPLVFEDSPNTPPNWPILGRVLGLIGFKPQSPTINNGVVSGTSTTQKIYYPNSNTDNDHDGLSDALETQIGFNPQNPTTFLQIPDRIIYHFFWIIKYLLACWLFYYLSSRTKL